MPEGTTSEAILPPPQQEAVITTASESTTNRKSFLRNLIKRSSPADEKKQKEQRRDEAKRLTSVRENLDQEISKDGKSRAFSRRTVLKGAAATAALAGIGIKPESASATLNTQESMTIQEGESSILLERQKLREDFKIPLYEGEQAEVAYEDIKYKLFTTNIERNKAMLWYLLNTPDPEGVLTDGKKQFYATVNTAAKLVLSMDRSEKGFDETTHTLHRILYDDHLPLLTERLHMEGNNLSYTPDEIRRTAESIDKLHKLQTIDLERAPIFREESIGYMKDLIRIGRLQEDPITTFLLNLDAFDDYRGDMAVHFIADKINRLASQNGAQGISATELLKNNNSPDEFTFATIAAEHASSSTWSASQIDWSKEISRHEEERLKQACELLAKKHRAWSEYVNTSLSHEAPTARKYNETNIYGEGKPCTEADIQNIFLSTTGDLFSEGRIPSELEIAQFRKETLPDNTLGVEFIVKKSVWENIKNNIPKEISPEEWFELHMQQANDMLQRAQPPTDLRIAIPRIIIMEDELLAKRTEKYEGKGAKERYGFVNPTPFGNLPQIDYLSPWSLDVQGRWVLQSDIFKDNTNNLDSSLANRTRTSPSGVQVPIDDGMTHEIMHQLILMQDLYQFNTCDKPDMWKGPYIDTVAEGIKRLIIAGGNDPDRALIPTLGQGEYLEEPWIDAAGLAWISRTQPDFLKTRYLPWLQSPYYHASKAEFFTMEGIGLKINAQIDKAPEKLNGLTIFPMKDGEDISAIAKQGNDSHTISSRDINKTMFNTETAGYDTLWKFDFDGRFPYHLPVPRYLISAPFQMTDSTGKKDMPFDVKFYQESDGRDYNAIDQMELYVVDNDDKFQDRINEFKDSLWATMQFTAPDGKIFYALWDMKMKNGEQQSAPQKTQTIETETTETDTKKQVIINQEQDADKNESLLNTKNIVTAAVATGVVAGGVTIAKKITS